MNREFDKQEKMGKDAYEHLPDGWWEDENLWWVYNYGLMEGLTEGYADGFEKGYDKGFADGQQGKYEIPYD